jgi:acyl-CoA reductase-like NAD-dependent aldehyde dehydrogenase
VSRILPALVGGNTAVVVAGGAQAVAAVELSEALATSDFPAGSINVLTGFADELAPWLAGHMDVNAIDLTGLEGDTAELERAAAENVKRVVRSSVDAQSPWEIAAFLELKTVWHPVGL